MHLPGITKNKLFLTIVLLIVLCLVIAAVFRRQLQRLFFVPTPSNIQSGTIVADDVTIIAEQLHVPWEVAPLPSGDILITERPGTLRRIGKDRRAFTISGVEHRGEGGLMGLVLHPDFDRNHFVYLYLTTRSGNALINRVERYTLQNDTLANKRTIVAAIPGAQVHDGGRMAFGPDKKLYITTGDASIPQSAQDTSSLAGKILRLNDDGTVPTTNPFGNAVYSYGHRNPQGIAWDDKGQLWATEHGPSGAQTGYDELNKITRGGNYGWPTVKGSEASTGMIPPVIHSGSKETWAPASLAYAQGSLFFAGLRGESLYQAKILPDSSVTLTSHLRGRYGRLRAVTVHNNSILVTTSNTDGRGDKQPNDDRLLSIPLQKLSK